MSQSQQIGTVKWFDAMKGYGFIKPDDGSQDVFIHISEVEAAQLKTLDPGQRLTFFTMLDQKGRRAAKEIKKTD